MARVQYYIEDGTVKSRLEDTPNEGGCGPLFSIFFILFFVVLVIGLLTQNIKGNPFVANEYIDTIGAYLETCLENKSLETCADELLIEVRVANGSRVSELRDDYLTQCVHDVIDRGEFASTDLMAAHFCSGLLEKVTFRVGG